MYTLYKGNTGHGLNLVRKTKCFALLGSDILATMEYLSSFRLPSEHLSSIKVNDFFLPLVTP